MKVLETNNYLKLIDIDKISEYLSKLNLEIESNPNKNLSLFNGEMGKVLYYFYYGNITKNKDFVQKGGELLKFIILEIEKGNANYLKNGSLSHGFAGLGLVIEILINEGYIENDFDLMLKTFDRFVYKECLKYFKNNSTDFLHAGFGSILYLFYRSSKNEEVIEFLHELLIEVKNNLIFVDEEKAYIGNSYLTKFGTGKDTISIGLAHGQIGNALILLKFIDSGLHIDIAYSILQPIINFILNLYIPDPSANESNFPFFVNLNNSDNKEYYMKAIRWCYGDINALHLLYELNRQFPNEIYKNMADLLGDRLISIKTSEEAGFRHTLLCHGTLGNAYYFKILFDLSKDEKYLDAYIHWINISFEIFDEELKDPEITNIAGEFLDGFVGSSLILLNIINPDANYWDKILLYS